MENFEDYIALVLLWLKPWLKSFEELLFLKNPFLEYPLFLYFPKIYLLLLWIKKLINFEIYFVFIYTVTAKMLLKHFIDFKLRVFM